ncbi:MAG TPA: 50S ribosomal protein L6 [Bacillota bacterium]|nr:50S ribosomal protein L6 [Bacillota bacterium]HPF42006.1 50S ribosomal protein L6 [Bacillota bacterium]HPJ85920.1 50S ribosomal protein L6 [Bacillota bacterium]HPQ61814.1 50S ribosomal protein L6 [Bacillota bacterium]HRX91209.1 50S ribosomal protein L6 [Candidatus Izemoplasmatales bacterium]
MSRIGKLPIVIPAGVSITVDKDNHVTVKGPKGVLEFTFSKDISIATENNEITVTRPSDSLIHRELHGTTRAVLNNMVVGVTEGYTKILDIKGVGYRAALKGSNILVLSVGYSNPVEIAIPENLTIEVPSNTEIFIKGIDKQAVGEFAAVIRKVRAPEPYQGKGIRYRGEHIRRKEGKTAK